MRQNLEEWERVISAAVEIQKFIPGCVLVGGSATAICAGGISSTIGQTRHSIGTGNRLSSDFFSSAFTSCKRARNAIY